MKTPRPDQRPSGNTRVLLKTGCESRDQAGAGQDRDSRKRGQARGYFAWLSMPCMPSQRAKASNQPVLVVSFGYMPKPCPPCS
jgi:hypothetical protein